MARNALLKQYLDAGMQFSQMTRERAEAIVKDLVDAGEVRRKKANSLVDDIVDRSRSNLEQLLDTVRAEVQNQLALVEVVTKEAFGRLEDQVGQLRTQVQELVPGGRPAPRRAAPARRKATAAKKAAPARRKATATKKAAAATKKAAAKRAPAKKKAAAKRAPAKRKAAAKKATARRATAKKA